MYKDVCVCVCILGYLWYLIFRDSYRCLRKDSFTFALWGTLIYSDFHRQDLLFQLYKRCFLPVFRTSITARFAWETHPRSITPSSKNGNYLSHMPLGLCSTNPVKIQCSLEQLQATQKSSFFLPHSLWILALCVHHNLHARHPKTATAAATAILWNALEFTQLSYQGVKEEAQTREYCSGNFAFVDSHLVLNEWGHCEHQMLTGSSPGV